jgi:chemotaxis protein CheX
MKVQYINPFIGASVNLFKEYLGLKVEGGKPRVLPNPQDLMEVSGIIGLAGETVGAVVLSFSRETAIAIVSRMEKTTYTALGGEVIDGVGELVNIIAGNAKRDLTQFRIEISLPGVVTGKSYQIHWPEGIPVVSIPFDSEVGPFSVNVSLRDMV